MPRQNDNIDDSGLARLVLRLLLQFSLVVLAGVGLWVVFEFLVRGAS
jgi:hypothetical protein